MKKQLMQWAGVGMWMVLGLSACSPTKTEIGNLNVIPQPQEVSQDIQAHPFVINPQTGIVYPEGNEKLQRTAEFLASYIKEATGITVRTTTEAARKNSIILAVDGSITNKEGYQLEVTSENIHLNGGSESGVFYGIQTLYKALPLTKNKQVSAAIPVGTVNDYPRFGYRGFMVDVGRHYFPVSYLKQIIDMLALHNINYFHWHLTEDQGWRIEIKKYPKLCQIGARRDSTQLNGWKGNSFDGKVHEGYYTQKEIKEIIEYAQSLHIQIIPEIEMPGHSSAVIAAYPEFGTTKKQIKVPCSFGVQYEVLDVSSQKVIQFLHDVLDEVIALFPSPIIHIGGDEVKYDQWNASVAISNYIKKLGVANPAELQIEFTNAISEWLKGRNKHMMGWNDIMGNKIHEYNSAEDAIALKSKLAEGTIVQFWKGDLDLIEETAQKGYDIVNSYHYGTYLDYDKSRIPLAKSYAFNPIPAGMDKSLQYKILGLGCQMWGEQILTVESMNRMTFPRIAAYAEIGWVSPARKNYMEFLPALMRLVKFNKHYETGER